MCFIFNFYKIHMLWARISVNIFQWGLESAEKIFAGGAGVEGGGGGKEGAKLFGSPLGFDLHSEV